MSLMEQIQAQQKKRDENRTLQVMRSDATDGAEVQDASEPVNGQIPSAPPSLHLEKERQTRQLGYRVPAETVHRFESYRNKLNELARRRGFKRQSLGDLAELALNLLMEHDPRAILGVKR